MRRPILVANWKMYKTAGEAADFLDRFLPRVAARKPGANVNAVTDDELRDAPSGASMLFGAPVVVESA